MKKILSIITRQQGFILPYVLFVSTIVIIIVTSMISVYRNEIELTNQYLEHIRVETLFQRGRTKLIEEMNTSSLITPSELTYRFNDGNVKIHVTEDEQQYRLLFTITTNQLKFKYTFPHNIQKVNNL
ncbi:hypothetical protein [Oceanobacillus senegalensis]|uniref:hypothetical protein n=1 Tax=Oceanobacillus senegalensis TaxID=1936063 RepID=UPI000A309803|nr:hypothetical protein [Oceanobacillus senegalensis]